MPTNNVPKGAGRAAHAAKTAKHAQRTPLPPKGATSGVSKKVSADPIAEESKMLKARSRGRKVRTSDAGTEALTSLFGAVAAPPKKAASPKKATPVASKAPAAKSASRGPEKAKSTPTAKVEPKKAASEPSGSKSDALVSFALSAGWKAAAEDGVAGSIVVIATRDPETVRVTFRDNKLDLAEMPTHEYSGRVVKLRNVSAAKKVMEASAEAAAASQPVSGPRRERKERERHEDDRGAVVITRRLPWPSDEEPTDEELIAYIVGKKLVWRNTVGGTYEEAHAVPSDKSTQVVSSPRNGKRVLNFLSAEGAFRSLYVENLVQIR